MYEDAASKTYDDSVKANINMSYSLENVQKSSGREAAN
jgi:hypothetical protein